MVSRVWSAPVRTTGDNIARYTIVGLIGRGGMGEVYEAEDTVLRRKVALKLLPPGGTEGARLRMLREARAAAAFEHPNAVLVYDAGIVDEGLPTEQTYLAMELVRGSTLRERIGDPSVKVGTKLRWLADAARALAAAHEVGLVHRDVKPDNLMVRTDGRIKVLDFGVVKLAEAAIDASAPTETPSLSENLTDQGGFVGTPKYAAPEQLRGEAVDGRSDQYAWGVTAFELLTGSAPFEADSGVALLSRILSSPAPKLRAANKELPEEVERVVDRALSKNPPDRFASLNDVAEALEPFADDSATETADKLAQPVRLEATSKSSSRNTTTMKAAQTVKKAARGYLWFAAGFGTLILGLLAFAAATGKLRFDLGKTTGSASAAAPPKAAEVLGIRCEVATLSGSGLSKTADNDVFARALGIGACARLAIDTGLPWGHDKATNADVDITTYTPLTVEVELATTTTVSLRLGERSAKSSASTSLDAVRSAVVELAKQFDPRPMTAEARAAWGADTDESAHRIERGWRLLVVGDLKDAEGEIRKLTETDGDSPWPHAMMCLIQFRGSAQGRASCKAALDRVAKLSPARSKAVQGVAIAVGDPARVDEAIKMFRQAYREAPDDADVAGLYGAVVLEMAPDEGFGVIDNVARRFPTYAIVPLSNALDASVRDAARNVGYMNRLNEILPEKACEGDQFNELLWDDKIAEARARLAACERLLGSVGFEFMGSLLKGQIDLAALLPEEARMAAQAWLGDPRDQVRTEATRQLIAAYLLAGRLREANIAIEAEMKRQRDQSSPRTSVQRGVSMVRMQRWLGGKLDPKIERFIRETYAEDKGAPVELKNRIDALLATVTGADLTKMTALAEAIKSSESSSDVFYAIPLLRAVYGDKATRELLQGRVGAASRARFLNALDYADLLEALKAPDAEIEVQLRLAMTPLAFDLSAIDKLVARLRLAKLYRKQGRTADADALHALVAKVWQSADPELKALIAGDK